MVPSSSSPSRWFHHVVVRVGCLLVAVLEVLCSTRPHLLIDWFHINERGVCETWHRLKTLLTGLMIAFKAFNHQSMPPSLVYYFPLLPVVYLDWSRSNERGVQACETRRRVHFGARETNRRHQGRTTASGDGALLTRYVAWLESLSEVGGSVGGSECLRREYLSKDWFVESESSGKNAML